MDEPPKIPHAEKTKIVHSYLLDKVAPHSISGWYLWLKDTIWRMAIEIDKEKR